MPNDAAIVIIVSLFLVNALCAWMVWSERRRVRVNELEWELKRREPVRHPEVITYRDGLDAYGYPVPPTRMVDIGRTLFLDEHGMAWWSDETEGLNGPCPTVAIAIAEQSYYVNYVL